MQLIPTSRPVIPTIVVSPLIVLCALTGPASAQAGSYTIIDIGDLAPDGIMASTQVTGMNELGHLAGITGDDPSGGAIPVLYRDGQLINLGGFVGSLTAGGSKGVNNFDQVVGWSMAPYPSGGYQSEPFVWTEGLGMINPIDDLSTNYSGESWGINDSGQQTFNVGGCSMYDPVAGFRQLHFPGSAANSGWKAWEINVDGVVCGSARGPSLQINAFRYRFATDTIENLNDPLIDHHSDAYGLNDRGDVAGWSVQFDGQRPSIVWTAQGQTLRLPVGDLGVDQVEGKAEHINNHGDVVGMDYYPGPTGGNPDLDPIGWVAFDALDTSPVVKVKLLSLLDPLAASEWRRLHPFEINDRGELCGFGVPAAGGFARGFLMLPNTPDRFRNLSHSLAGSDGHPVLSGRSTLANGTPLELSLTKAAPDSTAFLCWGLDAIYQPFAGGVMVPNALGRPRTFQVLSTDANGNIDLMTTWPAGMPNGLALAAGLDLVGQFWIVDSAAPFGLSASNAITQTIR